MTTWTRIALPAPRFGGDQAARLARFCTLHPGVKFVLGGELPVAWVGATRIEARTLRYLLDSVESFMAPDG